MSAGALVYALLTGTLVAIGCWAVEGLCRSARLHTRWAWALGLVALVAFAVGSVTRRVATSVPVRMLAVPTASSPAGADASPTLMETLSAAVDAGASAMRDAMDGAARALPAWTGTGAAMLWVATSMLMLVAIALVHLRVSRARRAWPAAAVQGHDVRIAPAVGPAVLGTVQPFIVVPRWLLERSDDEQRLVLAHESEHVRARDHLLLTGAWIAAAVVPWHPATWWMLSRLRLAIELDCDARVLRRGVAARVYGTLLIDLAGRCSGYTAGATALAEEGSHLERRLLAMKPITSRYTRLRAAALASAAGLALLAACEARIPTSAEIESMDVAAVQRQAAGMRIAAAGTTFMVDGKPSDEATAQAIAPDRIATVNVEKLEDRTVLVRITTLPTPRLAPAGGGEPMRVQVSELAPGARLRDSSQRMKVDATHRELEAGASTALSDIHATMKRLHSTKIHEAGLFGGILLIDGVRAASPTALHQLDPNSIVSVEVVKGAAATKLLNDPAAANGVIKVTTRRSN